MVPARFEFTTGGVWRLINFLTEVFGFLGPKNCAVAGLLPAKSHRAAVARESLEKAAERIGKSRRYIEDRSTGGKR